MKKFFKRLWKFIWILFLIFIISSLFFTLLYKFVNPPITPLMVIRLGDQLVSGKPERLKKSWVGLDQISKSLPRAVVASEDNNFMRHNGFDFEAIEKARDYNAAKKGKKIRGASTISQQTAKNVFLWPDRTWVRKGFETYFTFLIETFWSKKRILEVYLNVIETGDGIYGAEAAAETYFGKHASSLTAEESALIAAVLPNPRKWSPAHPTSYISGRQQWILWNMGNIGPLNY
ncbi:MAG: monofunctional biosynthetic peptidoglycan transglycosylase [Bacteroidota bacterium]|nr:monofunctional biosynthetic peptidoglycan transglycosylase [Bacteroidota bacterium]